jgi:hypothetical protein
MKRYLQSKWWQEHEKIIQKLISLLKTDRVLVTAIEEWKNSKRFPNCGEELRECYNRAKAKDRSLEKAGKEIKIALAATARAKEAAATALSLVTKAKTAMKKARTAIRVLKTESRKAQKTQCRAIQRIQTEKTKDLEVNLETLNKDSLPKREFIDKLTDDLVSEAEIDMPLSDTDESPEEESEESDVDDALPFESSVLIEDCGSVSRFACLARDLYIYNGLDNLLKDKERREYYAVELTTSFN